MPLRNQITLRPLRFSKILSAADSCAVIESGIIRYDARVAPPPRLRETVSARVCTENLNPNILVMKAVKDRERTDVSSSLNRARGRCIFVQ